MQLRSWALAACSAGDYRDQSAAAFLLRTRPGRHHRGLLHHVGLPYSTVPLSTGCDHALLPTAGGTLWLQNALQSALKILRP